MFDDEHKHRYNIRRWLDEWIRQAHLEIYKILGNGLSVIELSKITKGYLSFSRQISAINAPKAMTTVITCNRSIMIS